MERHVVYDSQWFRDRQPQARAALIGEKQTFSSPATPQTTKSVPWRTLVQVVSWLVLIVSLSFVVFTITPAVTFQLFPSDTKPIDALEEASGVGGDFKQGTASAQVQQVDLPPKDESLPEGSWMIIPRIGVRSQLQRTEDVEHALRTGLWWAPQYGDAGDKTQPMIVAAHRYGYTWWWEDNSQYWREHSFYLLPELEPGDLVEVIHDQRKWTYEIYAGEEGDEITDYYADLILYTCKHLKSPIRHFRYARLVDFETNTQDALTNQ